MYPFWFYIPFIHVILTSLSSYISIFRYIIFLLLYMDLELEWKTWGMRIQEQGRSGGRDGRDGKREEGGLGLHLRTTSQTGYD